MYTLLFQSGSRAKSGKYSTTRQVVGKRYFSQPKQFTRHTPAVNMLKIEGATCTPVNAPCVTSVPCMAAPTPPPVAPSPTMMTTPRVANQVNPLLGTRPLGTTRFPLGAGLQVINGGGA